MIGKSQFIFCFQSLNQRSEGRMRFPSTLCAAHSSLSIKPPLFCVTDLLLL